MLLPPPPALQSPAPDPGPAARLRGLLGVPYVEDAVLDEGGRWTTFAHPERTLPAPGLNCSGFLVAAARRLLGFAGTSAEAARDRLGDNRGRGHAAPDWDFGWDLVLNLSEGRPRRWILPAGPREAPGGDGESLEGFPVQDDAAWERVLARMEKGMVYLATLYRGKLPRRRVHHHGALILKEEGGRTGLYQTLPKGRVHRLEIGSAQGRQRLHSMFGPGERILLLEVQPPP